MSVRRLADAAIQPPAFAFSADNARWATAKMAEYPAGRQQSAVIPLLWRAQEQEGWVTRPAIEAVANMLGMAYIRVLEVATFYTQFLLKPVGSKAHVLVCGTTPCMLRGAEDLRAVCEHRINHEPLTVNAAGTLSWEEVECLGACVNAPMIMIGNDTYEDLTVERFEQILDDFEAGKGASVKPGTQIDRVTSAAEGGATTLLETPTAERTYKPFPPPPAPAPAPGAPAAAAPAPAAVAPAQKAAEPPPTTPGSKNQVSAEAAPALKGPAGAPKATVAAADGERSQANASAKADGTPNTAMREGATGAESPAGKVDGGKTTGEKTPAKPIDPPVGQADDLKLIAGIGPVLERALNEHGIATFARVAALTPADITSIEEKLKFPGRVTRDDWIRQAEALARGGAAEYRKVFGKDPR
ncbi:MAG: NADH-quinone oxidoreductase subunit NuoE [Devosia sp.]